MVLVEHYDGGYKIFCVGGCHDVLAMCFDGGEVDVPDGCNLFCGVASCYPFCYLEFAGADFDLLVHFFVF